MKKPSYLWAAFTARPFGMPIPPNFFGLAAAGMLGAFINPGFFLIGLGLEIAYLYTLSSSERFRKAVDASQRQVDPADQRYAAQLEQLDAVALASQREVEARAREIFATLGTSPLLATHADSLSQLVWLHLRLLVARRAIGNVVSTAETESTKLDAQEAQIVARLESNDLSPELRRSLEQQKAVIDQRQEAHANASRRLEHVDSELARIHQQIALIREQALLASDDEHVGASLDALAASFNEANRWLANQRDLLGTLDFGVEQRLPQSVLQGPPPAPKQSAPRQRQAQRQ